MTTIGPVMVAAMTTTIGPVMVAAMTTTIGPVMVAAMTMTMTIIAPVTAGAMTMTTMIAPVMVAAMTMTTTDTLVDQRDQGTPSRPQLRAERPPSTPAAYQGRGPGA